MNIKVTCVVILQSCSKQINNLLVSYLNVTNKLNSADYYIVHVRIYNIII